MKLIRKDGKKYEIQLNTIDHNWKVMEEDDNSCAFGDGESIAEAFASAESLFSKYEQFLIFDTEESFKEFFEEFLDEKLDDICKEIVTSDGSVCVDAYVNMETFNIFYVCECSNNYSLSEDSLAVAVTGISQNCDRDLEYHQCYDCSIEHEFKNGEISEEKYEELRRECEAEMHYEFFRDNEKEEVIENAWEMYHKIHEQEYERMAIRDFILNDNSDFSSILVEDIHGNYEERNTLNNTSKVLFKEPYSQILAESPKNWEYLRDICDNCEYDCYDEEKDESYCENGASKIECAIEDAIATSYRYE